MHSARGRVTAAVVVALHALPVKAQDALAPVVVTATRFPERALGTAIGTRVITAEDIGRSAARTLPEIIGQLGGVHIRDASGSPNQQLDLRGFQKADPEEFPPVPGLEVENDNAALDDALASGAAQVGAGTVWLWAREAAAEALDYLVVDEAGQLSLANAVAAVATPSTRISSPASRRRR